MNDVDLRGVVSLVRRADEMIDDLRLARYGYMRPHDEAALRALAFVIEKLVDVGHFDILVSALNEYDQELRALNETWRAANERRQRDYDEAARRHAVAVTVACPFCGADPGASCRTAGPSGKSLPKGVHDHKDRYRLATKLNEGAA